MSTPLVVALHGSTHPGAGALAAELTDDLRRRLPGVAVTTGWADVETERLEHTLAGIGPAVVVPAFLTAGYHVTDDLPAALARAGGRASLTPHIGPLMVPAVAHRARQAGGPGDGVLLAAPGSRRPDALQETEDAAATLAGLLGVPVRAGYLYSGRPSLEAAWRSLAAEGLRDMTVVPFALAPGRYTARLDALGAARVARPIGAHPALASAIATRYIEATTTHRRAA